MIKCHYSKSSSIGDPGDLSLSQNPFPIINSQENWMNRSGSARYHHVNIE